MIGTHICDTILNHGHRDLLLTQMLHPANLMARPLNILQVGAIEDLTLRFRHGSGWSDIFFASYISMFGGSLTVVDIDQSHLDNSEKVLSEFHKIVKVSPGEDLQVPAKYSLVLSDALDFIKGSNDSYDIIYLDGSNDPEETKSQYDAIDKDSTSVILVDDFSIKGSSIEFDKRYSGEIYPATKEGVYLGVNIEALNKLRHDLPEIQSSLNKLWNEKIL